MNKLWIIPLESVQGRYTKQWRDNIPPAFIKAGFDVEVIDGEQLTDFVGVGTFLDIHTTIHYKNSQIQKVAKLFMDKKIQNGDQFFFFDYEFWGGVESVRLLAQMNKLNVKIYAFAHAGSYTVGDAFAVAKDHQKYIEVGWIAACDKVFVGSEYHKQAIIDRRLKPVHAEALADRIVVTGNPQFADDYKKFDVKKKRQIILPNRFDAEKNPDVSLQIAYLVRKMMPDVDVIVTTSHPTFKSNKPWLEELARQYENDGIIKIYAGLSKDEYHKLMAESMIMLSCSPEENFGISIYEAMTYHTCPILLNNCSHPELVNNTQEFLYDDMDHILDKIKYILDNNNDPKLVQIMNNRVAHYNNSINRIITEFNIS